jgi:hypothetical protein
MHGELFGNWGGSDLICISIQQRAFANRADAEAAAALGGKIETSTPDDRCVPGVNLAAATELRIDPMNIPLRVTFMASDAEHVGEYFEEPHLRFNVGDRVSASIGAPGERKPGTIMALKYNAGGGTAVDKIVPYQIILDSGGKIYSEGDDDSYVKAIPTPVLRFKVGDRVSANVDDGWKPGTIVKLNYIPDIDHILKAEEQRPLGSEVLGIPAYQVELYYSTP